MDEGDRAALGPSDLFPAACPAPERGEDAAQEDVEDVPDEPGIVGHPEAKRERKREHPLAANGAGEHPRPPGLSVSTRGRFRGRGRAVARGEAG